MNPLTRRLERVQRPSSIWFSAGVLALIVAASLGAARLGSHLLGQEPQQGPTNFYVNAGDCGPADWAGVTWQADQPYSEGGWGHAGDFNAGSWEFPLKNLGEDDQGLHRCRAWGTGLSYLFDVPNGEYKIRLRFAEPLHEPGQRWFDVALEGQPVLDNFDIAAEAGGDGVIIEREFVANVQDGQLNIDFSGNQGSEDANALVQAIAIEGQFVPDPPAEEPPAEQPPAEAPPTEAPPVVVEPPVVEPPVEGPSLPYAQFVNAGACGPAAWQGFHWAADQPYAAGSWGYVGADRYAIPADGVEPVVDEAGSPFDEAGQLLHRCQVYGTDFGYHFDVPDGSYVVRLRFAEPLREPGGRWFDVAVEGQTVLDDFDVAAEAGAVSRAVEKDFQVTVEDGRLEVDFVGGQPGSPDPNAFVQAVAVIAQELWVEPTPFPEQPAPEPTAPPAEPTAVPPEPGEEPIEPPGVEPTVAPTETVEPSPEPTDAIADRDRWFVNAGQCGAVEWEGFEWQADQPYSAGGWGHVGPAYQAVADIVDPVADEAGDLYGEAGQYLHRCQVYGRAFGYHFDLPDGDYIVSLRFAEPLRVAGQRWFDVVAENQTVLDDFDVAAAAGGPGIAVERSFAVSVSDGKLELEFVGGQAGSSDENAFVQAIAVALAELGVQPPSAPDPTVEPGAEPTAGETPSPAGTPTPEPTLGEPTLQPTAALTAEPAEERSAGDAPGYDWYVNVGECQAVVWQGVTWEDDRPYTPGGWGYVGSDYTAREPGFAWVKDASGQALSSEGQVLFRCRSFGTDFGYRFDVPDGDYTVTLYFVEPLYSGKGMRRFDVALENRLVLDNFDILAQAGGKGVLLERSFPVEVADGQLEIDLRAGSGASDTKPIIQAIHVTGGDAAPAPTQPPAPAPTVAAPTGAPTATTLPPTATPVPTLAPTAIPSPEPSPEQPVYAQYVNVGACSAVGWQGVTWEDDRPYTNSGWGYVGSDYTAKDPGLAMVSDPSGVPYGGEAQDLHRCRSYGRNFGYRFNVPNGKYRVSLRFVEPLYDSAGRRVFDVRIEDQLAINNLDIWAQAGGKGRVLVRNFLVTVWDGQLKIDLAGESSAPDPKAILQAISVVSDGYTTPVDPPPSSGAEPTPAPTQSPTPTSAPLGRVPVTHETANPSAIPAAKEILSYLYSLPGRSDNRVISGQFGSYGDGTSVSTAQRQMQGVYDQTGRWPALTGMDYRNWDMSHGNNLSDANRYLIEHWNNGGLVTVSWHANNPWTGGSSNDKTITSLTDLTQPGRPGHDQWMRQLDDIASGLQELEDAGVVVIWRPLHEMNGGWFWWWGNEDKEGFKKLWQHMFNYFTYQKGLDNLLWAWSPNYAYDQWTADLLEYYPGSAYVDIVGMDKYRGLSEQPLNLNGGGTYDKLVSTGKPVALLEFGPTPASSWPDRPNWDYAQLIRTIREQYPRIVMFQAWEWHWQIPKHDNATGLMHDSWTIDRDELPTWSR